MRRPIVILALWLPAAVIACAAQAAPAAGDAPAAGAGVAAPPPEDIAEHKTYDPGPELQRTPGGSLIVNAFIMEGPVRLEILDRTSGKTLLEQNSDTLFPFEVSGTDLGTEPENVRVRIHIDGALAHELTLER